MANGKMTGVVLGGLAVLAVSAGSASAKTVIKYWEKWGGAEGTYIQAVVDRYNKMQNRVEVRYSFIPATDIHEKFLTTTVAGAGPDIVGLWNHRVPFFVDAGLVRPLDPYLKVLGIDKRSVYPRYWDMGSVGGKVYALPITNACFGLYSNTAVLAESGLDPNTAPKTFDDLMELSEKVSKRDAAGKWTRVGYAPNDPGWWPYIWGPAFGASLYNEKTGAVDLSQPNLVKAYDFIANTAKKYGPNILGIMKAGGSGQKNSALYSGKTAFEINGSWQASAWMKAVPNAKWALHPIPYGGGRTSPWSWMESDMVFLAKTKNTEAAIDFLKYLVSVDGQQNLNLRRETFSAFKAANNADFVKRNGNPAITDMVRLIQGEEAEFAPKTIIWNDLADTFATVFNDTWNLRKGAAQSLKDADRPIQAALKKIQRRKR